MKPNYSEVPEDIAFVQMKGRYIPVTRVIKSTQGEEISIRTFGPIGEFLQVTLGRIEPSDACFGSC